ncbi:class I SAM-dependent methyltransferase [Candidatus Uhrbacteria bacterium]|nr:class I SAM-dependent methyltransferase [Candidatus Uhrbacteria bacterium]
MDPATRTPTLLVNSATAAKWEAAHAAGTDKKFPNLDLVRLQHWYFKDRPGRLLEYGFGCGVNLLFLLECGHDVHGLEVAPSAKRNVETKLAHRPEIAARATLSVLPVDSQRLPFADASFDYVVCVSVLSLLGSRVAVDALIAEFTRILRSGGKGILDINGPRGDFAQLATPLGGDVYETRGATLHESPHRSYCPPTAEEFAALVREHLTIDDIGYSSHKLFHSEIQEFIICAHKA